MECPYCKSKDIIKNGHAPSGKMRWKCNKCKKTFSKDSGNGFPPTSVEFRFINFILHYCKDYSLDKTHTYVNNKLKLFKFRNVSLYKKEKISRSTVYKWKRKEREYLRLIPGEEALNYYQHLVRQIASPWPKELIPPEPPISDVEEVEIDVKKTIPGTKSYGIFLKFIETLYKEEYEKMFQFKGEIIKMCYSKNELVKKLNFPDELAKIVKDHNKMMELHREFKKPITISVKEKRSRIF
jgi:transposase-like protein